MRRTMDRFPSTGGFDMTVTSPQNMDCRLQENVDNLLTGQGLGVLSTTGPDGHPYASLIAFAVADSEPAPVLRNPHRNPQVPEPGAESPRGAAGDQQREPASDFHQAMAVTVLGTARQLEAEERNAALAVYLRTAPLPAAFRHGPILCQCSPSG
jgi:hypothetical protein